MPNEDYKVPFATKEQAQQLGYIDQKGILTPLGEKAKTYRQAQEQGLIDATGVLTELGAKTKAEMDRQDRLYAIQTAWGKVKDQFAGTMKPLQVASERYKRESYEGAKAVAEAVEDPGIWTGLKGALGGVQYTAAPITAGAAGVGQAVEQALATAAPEQVADFVGRMAEEGVNLAPVGGLAAIGRHAKAAREAEKVMERARVIRRGPRSEQPEFVRGIEEPLFLEDVGRVAMTRDEWLAIPSKLAKGEALDERVKDSLVQMMAQGADLSKLGEFDKSQRIFLRLAEVIKGGDIDVAQLPRILEKYDLSSEDFARMFVETASEAGRTLGHLSWLKKQLGDVFKDNPEVLAQLAKMGGEGPTMGDRIWFGLKDAENVRRGLLVTQLATASRNAISQTGRLAVGGLDNIFQSVLTGDAKGDALGEVRRNFNDIHAIFSRLNPKQRSRVLDLLGDKKFALEEARFLGPVHEAVGGPGIVRVLNKFNRLQEHFFRKIAFESRLRSNIANNPDFRKAGITYDTIDPKLIPQEMMEDAVNHSLEMTFAHPGHSKFQRDIVQGFSKFWPAYTLQPFPRFNYANALPFLFDHSPLGYLHAFKPEVIQKLARGDAQEFAKAASRATIGTMMFDSAWRIRQSDMAGEKWYEIIIGLDEEGKQIVIDARPFAPFSTYLFLAEAMLRPKNIEGKDWALATIGVNRVAGTGLAFVDLMRGKVKEQTVKDVMGSVAGAYLGGFTVPFGTVKDLYSGLDPEETITRDTRQNPFLGNLMRNLPEASQLLPEVNSMTTTKRVRAENPITKQLTGLRVKTKDPVSRKIDELNMSWGQLSPRTGNKQADNIMRGYMGQAMEVVGPKFIASKEFQAMGPATQAKALNELFKITKGHARARLANEHPRLNGRLALEGIPMIDVEFLKEQGVDIPSLIEQLEVPRKRIGR